MVPITLEMREERSGRISGCDWASQLRTLGTNSSRNYPIILDGDLAIAFSGLMAIFGGPIVAITRGVLVTNCCSTGTRTISISVKHPIIDGPPIRPQAGQVLTPTCLRKTKTVATI